MTFTVTGVPYPDTFEESWMWVLQEIEEYPATDYWQAYKAFVIPLLKEAIASGIHRYFRAGMSMSQVILSTSDRRLELVDPPPPRVTLQCEALPRFVAWSHANIFFSEPERRESLSACTALETLRPFLVDLWHATRPNENIPRCLAT